MRRVRGGRGPEVDPGNDLGDLPGPQRGAEHDRDLDQGLELKAEWSRGRFERVKGGYQWRIILR